MLDGGDLALLMAGWGAFGMGEGGLLFLCPSRYLRLCQFEAS